MAIGLKICLNLATKDLNETYNDPVENKIHE